MGCRIFGLKIEEFDAQIEFVARHFEGPIEFAKSIGLFAPRHPGGSRETRDGSQSGVSREQISPRRERIPASAGMTD